MCPTCEGTDSVAEFSIRFRTLALEAGWDERALKGVFLKALNEPLKDELACRDDPPTLDALIALAIRLNNRLSEHCQEKTERPKAETRGTTRTVTAVDREEIDTLRVTPEMACDIIVACVILHNIATIRGEQCPTIPLIIQTIILTSLLMHETEKLLRDLICLIPAALVYWA